MRKELLGTRDLMRLLAIVLLSVVLAACGSEDSDEDPTATSAPADAQPTVSADSETPGTTPGTPESTSAPTNTDMSAVQADATAAEATPEPVTSLVSTPAAPAMTQATPLATPTDEETSAIATPAPDVAAPGTDAESTPTSIDESIPADTQVGDGTTGAIVAGATPASTPASAASPIAGATPAAPPIVTGCEAIDVPPFTGEVTTFTLTTDLNFRTGPGPDCELALPQPIGAFQAVEVIGGPVIQEEDGSEWVQIQTLDTTGWVAFEFLEPVED